MTAPVHFGIGTLALTASNSFVGNMIVNAGVLSASHNYALGASDAVVTGSTGVSGGKVFVQPTGELDLSNNIALGGAGGKTLYLSGSGIAGAGALHNVGGANSNSGQVVLQSDTTIAADAGTQLTLSGAISGSAALIKIGAGTLVLSATNSYTGPTNINGGTVLVHGAITGGAVSVNTSGTLAGDGSVGALTVNTGAVLTPGDATTGKGTLKAGNLTVQNNMTLALALTKDASGTAGTDYAKLAAGTLNLSAITHITVSLQNVLGDGAPFDPTIICRWLNIITTTGLTGFSSSQFAINSDGFLGATGLGGNFTLVQNQNDVNALDLYYMAIPEPQTWVILLGSAGVLGFLKRFRRRAPADALF